MRGQDNSMQRYYRCQDNNDTIEDTAVLAISWLRHKAESEDPPFGSAASLTKSSHIRDTLGGKSSNLITKFTDTSPKQDGAQMDQ